MLPLECIHCYSLCKYCSGEVTNHNGVQESQTNQPLAKDGRKKGGIQRNAVPSNAGKDLRKATAVGNEGGAGSHTDDTVGMIQKDVWLFGRQVLRLDQRDWKVLGRPPINGSRPCEFGQPVGNIVSSRRPSLIQDAIDAVQSQDRPNSCTGNLPKQQSVQGDPRTHGDHGHVTEAGPKEKGSAPQRLLLGFRLRLFERVLVGVEGRWPAHGDVMIVIVCWQSDANGRRSNTMR